MAMEPVEIKCENCKFYKDKHGNSCCCYNPPTWTVISPGDPFSAFPTVTPDDRCGKFEPAPMA